MLPCLCLLSQLQLMLLLWMSLWTMRWPLLLLRLVHCPEMTYSTL